MVKGKTKSGIEFKINENVKNDARTLYLMTKMQDSSDPSAQSKALFDLLKLVFGSEEGMVSFMDAVASKHKGVCGTDVMIEELTEMFDSINLKNS